MNETLIQGLTLMGIGMGFVLTFLCILIAAMNIMSAFVGYLNKIFPEKVEVTEKKSVCDDSAVALAIVAAMSRK